MSQIWELQNKRDMLAYYEAELSTMTDEKEIEAQKYRIECLKNEIENLETAKKVYEENIKKKKKKK